MVWCPAKHPGCYFTPGMGRWRARVLPDQEVLWCQNKFLPNSSCHFSFWLHGCPNAPWALCSSCCSLQWLPVFSSVGAQLWQQGDSRETHPFLRFIIDLVLTDPMQFLLHIFLMLSHPGNCLDGHPKKWAELPFSYCFPGRWGWKKLFPPLPLCYFFKLFVWNNLALPERTCVSLCTHSQMALIWVSAGRKGKRRLRRESLGWESKYWGCVVWGWMLPAWSPSLQLMSRTFVCTLWYLFLLFYFIFFPACFCKWETACWTM